MKNLKLLALLILVSATMLAQKGGRGHHAHPRNVIVKRSPFRPAKMIVYHPHWHPQFTCHRRWVYFPKYNIYWDNWRNHYVFWNGRTWLSQASAPTLIVNVQLQNEKHAELKEEDDDNDEVFNNNKVHQTEYKSE